VIKSIILILSFFSFSLFGDVFFSIEYNTSIATLEKIQSALKKASERSDKMQSYPAFYSLTDHVSLICKPNMPDASKAGCNLSFSSKENKKEEVSISFQKRLKGNDLDENINKIKKLTENRDPNMTEDHLHIGNPFIKDSDDASHFFCQPEGNKPNRKWVCYLFIAEAVKAPK